MARCLLLAALTLLLMSCGGGDEKPPATATSTPTRSQGEAELPIHPDRPALYMVNSDGSGLRELIAGSDSVNFAVSADGTRVAATAGGAGRTKLTFFDGASGAQREEVRLDGWFTVQAWSPDGRWLALQSFSESTGAAGVDLYSIASREIAHVPVENGFFARWSSTGDAVFVWPTTPPQALYRVTVPSLQAAPFISDDQNYPPFAAAPDGATVAVGLFGTDSYTIALHDNAGLRQRDLVTFTDEAVLSGGHTLSWSPDGRRLAYGRLVLRTDRGVGADGSGVYVLDLQTGVSVQVTAPEEGVEGGVQWSPDGERLLVIRNICTSCDGTGQKVVLASADGSNEVALPGTESWQIAAAAWSPSGDRFAYSADALYVASADGGDVQKIAELPGVAYQPVAWTAADRIFLVRRGGFATTYAANADGSGLQVLGAGLAGLAPDGRTTVRSSDGNLVVFRPGEQPVTIPGPLIFAHEFSPDGERLAVNVRRNEEVRLEVLQPDGAVTVLARHQLIEGFRWSPAGKQIAFVADGAIWAVEAAGGGPRRLAIAPQLSALDWSPDGTQIVYGAQGAVFSVPADGKSEPVQRFVIDEQYFLPTELRWSPDGERVAFAGDRTLYTGTIATGEVTKVADMYVSGLAWSPDGTRFAFGGAPSGGVGQPPGVYIVDAVRVQLTQLTAALQFHRLLYWLTDGRIVFTSSGN